LILGSLASSPAVGGRRAVAGTQTGVRVGVGVGVTLAVGVGVVAAVGVGVCAGVALAVGVGVDIALAVGVGVGLKVGVGRGGKPPTKENSVVSEDDSHGTCSPRVALMTPACVLRSACSALVPGALISRRSSVERGRIEHQSVVRRHGRRKARGISSEAPFERIAASRFEQGDLHQGAARVHLAQNGFEVETVVDDVRLHPDLRIDRQQIGLPRRLDAEAIEEQQCDAPRLNFCIEAVERLPHCIAREVQSPLDVKSVALQLVGDLLRVIGGVGHRQVVVGVFGVADHQRDLARRVGCGAQMGNSREQACQQQHNERPHEWSTNSENWRTGYLPCRIFQSPRGWLHRMTQQASRWLLHSCAIASQISATRT